MNHEQFQPNRQENKMRAVMRKLMSFVRYLPRLLFALAPIGLVGVLTYTLCWWKIESPIELAQLTALCIGALALGAGIGTRRMFGFIRLGEVTVNEYGRNVKWIRGWKGIGGICFSWKSFNKVVGIGEKSIMYSPQSTEYRYKCYLDIRGLVFQKAREREERRDVLALIICNIPFTNLQGIIESRPMGARYEMSWAVHERQLDGDRDHIYNPPQR